MWSSDTRSAPAGHPQARGLPDALARVPLAGPLDRLARLETLDGVNASLRRGIRRLPLGAYRDVLRGRWLGHPLHPVLVQVPIGSWTSAAVLDLFPGARRDSAALVALGVLAAGPAALAGWVDWAEQHPEQQRTGLVHALANTVAVGLYAGSLAARLRGRGVRGRALGFAGLTAASAGGVLGGHLAYRQAVGGNKAEPVRHLAGADWRELGPLADFPAGEPVRVQLGAVPLFVLREGDGEVRVLAEQCSHQAGPLADGEIADGCVTCPWHGSVFRLADGWNIAGPATAPQPVFETRVRDDGVLEARPGPPG
ncbi:Rieske (2Fe-2S) protein [Streptomyces oceani]|uniref:Rieske 2Fe-2S domain-containing protein n=1 Tax=Streptomyces oceani TaxID=1075402 RepID=UPI000871FB36